MITTIKNGGFETMLDLEKITFITFTEIMRSIVIESDHGIKYTLTINTEDEYFAIKKQLYELWGL